MLKFAGQHILRTVLTIGIREMFVRNIDQNKRIAILHMQSRMPWGRLYESSMLRHGSKPHLPDILPCLNDHVCAHLALQDMGHTEKLNPIRRAP